MHVVGSIGLPVEVWAPPTAQLFEPAVQDSQPGWSAGASARMSTPLQSEQRASQGGSVWFEIHPEECRGGPEGAVRSMMGCSGGWSRQRAYGVEVGEKLSGQVGGDGFAAEFGGEAVG